MCDGREMEFGRKNEQTNDENLGLKIFGGRKEEKLGGKYSDVRKGYLRMVGWYVSIGFCF